MQQLERKVKHYHPFDQSLASFKTYYIDKPNMCVQDKEQVSEEMEILGGISSGNGENRKNWPLHSEIEDAQNENRGKITSFDLAPLRNSFPVSILHFFFFHLNFCLSMS